MAWEVEFTDEFADWWNSLHEGEQEDVQASVILLRERGPALGRPHVDLVTSSAYPNIDRWYMEFVPRADKVYAEHLRQIEKGRERSVKNQGGLDAKKFS